MGGEVGWTLNMAAGGCSCVAIAAIALKWVVVVVLVFHREGCVRLAPSQ